MAVNLSPIWGAGAQLLDNSGNVLSGGKIYTYAAGTTTPAATYTSSNGLTANSNPIILNSAGRVPYEIWLTDGVSYKFVLKDSNDVLIATYDNLTGINSNFIAYTAQQEIQTATAGQTVFNLTTMQYQPATNNLSVFVDGVNQYGPGAQYAYVETDSDTVTFVSGLHVGASVKFTTASPVASAVTNAADVAYDPPFTGAVGTNVEAKLAQTVSVKDFGAVGDGVTDDTAAIQAALDACDNANTTLHIPSGTYLISNTLNFGRNPVVGDGPVNTTIKADSAVDPMIKLVGTGSEWNFEYGGFSLDGNSVGVSALQTNGKNSVVWRNIRVSGFSGINVTSDAYLQRFENCFIYGGSVGYYVIDSVSSGSNGTVISGGVVASQTSYGVQITSINGNDISPVRVFQTDFESIPTAIKVTQGAASIQGLSIDQCRFEGNTTYCIDIGDNVFSPVITSNTMAGSSGSPSAYFIRIAGPDAVIANNYFVANVSTACIDLIYDARRTFISGNSNNTGAALYVDGNTSRVLTLVNPTTGLFLGARYVADQGSAITTGDIVLSSNWGSTASVNALSATDQRGRIQVSSSGTGQALGASIVMTFKTPWETTPHAVVCRRGGGQLTVGIYVSCTTTEMTIAFNGTPVAGEVYDFSFVVMG